MGSSLTLFRIWDINVRVHWSFVLILLWGAFMYGGQANPTVGAAYGILVVILLFACVTLHEFGHALVAKYFKINVPDITLLPIGGVAQLERMPDKPFQEFLIAIAGPLVNVAISILLIPIWLIVTAIQVNAGEMAPISWSVAELLNRFSVSLQSPSLIGLLEYLMVVNFSLAIFNLLPAFPMDGGRILRAVMATAMPYVQATRIAVLVGRIIAVLLAIWGVTGGGIGPLLIAFFIYVGGGSERESVESRAILKDVKIKNALNANAANLYTSERLSRAVEMIMTSYQTDYPVVDLGGKVVGVLTRARMVAALRSSGPETRIADVMIPIAELPTMQNIGNLAEVWETIARTGSRVVVIRDGNDFQGILTLDDVSELFEVMGASYDRSMSNPPGGGEAVNPPAKPREETARV